MNRKRIAFGIVILISCFALVWASMPTIRASTPIWLVIDLLVAQIVIVTSLSRA